MGGSIFVLTLGDVVGLGALAIIAAIAGASALEQAIRRGRCRHDGGVNETSACDAICRKCGKNLGFIGSWRERQKGG